MNAKFKLIVLVVSFCASLLVGRINVSYVKEFNPENRQQNNFSLVHDATIWSIDNEWYIPQAQNILKGHGYILDIENPQSRVRRTPGYSLWLTMHYAVFGEKTAHVLLPFTQSLVYAIGILLLVLTAFNFTRSKTVAYITFIITLLSPFAIGYTFYTITEAIHPSLIIFPVYFFSRYTSNLRNRELLMAGCFTAIVTLVRPTSGLMIVALGLGVILWTLYHKKTIGKALVSLMFLGVGFVLFIAPWVIRNAIVQNEFVLLEKFYNESPIDLGRSQTYMTKWLMAWKNPNPVEICTALIVAAREKDFEYKKVHEMVAEMPDIAFRGYQREDVIDAFKAMQDCYFAKLEIGHIRVLKPGESELICEREVSNKFSILTEIYAKDSPVRYYFISPFLIRGKEFILHSFSTMHPILLSDRTYPHVLKMLTKGMLYLINVLLYVGTVFFVFIVLKRYVAVNVVIIFILLTFLYLVYSTHIEARYLLAAYPFLTLCTAISIKVLFFEKNSVRSIGLKI